MAYLGLIIYPLVIGKLDGLPLALIEEELRVVAVVAFPDHPAPIA
jgi:hypothetical protein